MDEELNEHDLEERLYAMLHHVDETEGNLISKQSDGLNILEVAPRSNARRYWRTSEPTTPYQKVNAPKDPVSNIRPNTQISDTAKPKEEKRDSPEATADLSIFQSPVPQNFKRTIEFLDHDDNNQVLLETSDEDEVIEVALPPKPTITIESSDEDELQVINPVTPTKNQDVGENKISNAKERDVTASPAPSGVSSVSDEFIRGDCIALNISSRHQDNPSFDFSLHGSDLLDQNTPSKKKKRKKNKETATSTPVVASSPAKDNNDGYFATPKSKAKNKKQKTKTYSVTEKSVPSADVYDSDSNQSIDTNKNKNYVVTEKSLPSTDVYESDSNLSECAKETVPLTQTTDVDNSDISIILTTPSEQVKTSKKKDSSHVNESHETITIVDLTEDDRSMVWNNSTIQESIIMGNVSGFIEPDDYADENISQNMSDSNISKFGSTKIPAILNEDLDFDNLKGKDKVCKRRRYSLTTLRAEMEKFYNESWGGENFNHREIQKNMSRDKSLWVIDPKDRMPPLTKRKIICNYCNRPGHRDDSCRQKPAVCYMCGSTGHYEPRCPRKICVNCGSPNQMYSTMCRNCCNWTSLNCAECGQRGHPASHCPDLWRRYHNTIDNNSQLERCNQTKKSHQQFCSGCTRRGHLIHSCRITIPFTSLPINSPYVQFYRPVYPPDAQKQKNTQNPPDNTPTPTKNDRNKRQSKSPTAHETHLNKKRNLSASEETERRNTKSPVTTPQRKTSLSKDVAENSNKKDTNKTVPSDSNKNKENTDKAPNYIPLSSTNRDKEGNMIQDNEVSDTSDVVTSARIYVTNDIIQKLNTDDGKAWLQEVTLKHSVEVEPADVNSFLSIKGKLVDQEAFQTELRDWVKPSGDSAKPSTEGDTQQESKTECNWSVIPKNRNNLLRQLHKALESLNEDLGDPNVLYKELTYFQNHHQQLMRQKVVNPKQLNNSRGNINQMFKKLNMVLLGQAGLADGSQHLTELYAVQQRLMNLRQKTISNELRKEIGEHYANIFTAAPRNDYLDLLKTYQNTKRNLSVLKRKRQKAFKVKPIGNRPNKNMSIPVQPAEGREWTALAPMPGVLNKAAGGLSHEATDKFAHKSANELSRLQYLHSRVRRARPTLAALKRTRAFLERRLHFLIASALQKEKVSSKTLKKMRRTREQAQIFLADV